MLVCDIEHTGVQTQDLWYGMYPSVVLQYAHLHNLLFSEYIGRLVFSRWLQLVATLVEYNHNLIENMTTLS